MKEIIFIDITEDEQKLLLDSLGYDVNTEGVIIDRNTNKPHKCPITKKKVYLKNASILPGSLVIINTSPLTLAEYLSRYVERD